MKILHVIGGELSGGAARGAYWLHKGLRSRGVESMVLTNSIETYGDDTVYSLVNTQRTKAINIFRRLLDGFFAKFYSHRQKKKFSTGFVGFDFINTSAYKQADIVHLHWINNGFINIKHLAKIKKPVVWTMRDMWPMTGGCHYSLDCDRFSVGCGVCPQLGSKRVWDLSRLVLKRKEKYLPKSLKLIGISEWLSTQARKSKIFSHADIRTISNNISKDIFFPIDKKSARDSLGLQTNKKIVLIGSINTSDFYKGFNKFLESTRHLNKENIFICFFGKLNAEISNNLDFEHVSFEFLHDPISLRLVYSAADVFVAPSIMDAFGKTIAEAMACGTPAVCFDATGPKDIVTHMIDGYKAKPFSAEDLAHGIRWVLNAENYAELCEMAAKHAVEKFDSIKIAEQYINLYKEILDVKQLQKN